LWLSIENSSGWVQLAQIGLGLIILFLSIVVLINSILGGISVIFFLALLLLFAGIEMAVCASHASPEKVRMARRKRRHTQNTPYKKQAMDCGKSNPMIAQQI